MIIMGPSGWPLLATVCALLTACDVGGPQSEAEAPYQATIVRTEWGIPHISADDWGSLGFGEAYAAAEDHLCNMAWALLQARGETAKYLGLGEPQEKFAHDAVVKGLAIPARGESALAAQTPQIQTWLRGYAAGYNHYLAQHAKQLDGRWCANAPWVQPVSAEAFMTQYILLVQTLPRVASAIVAAQLPEPKADERAANNTAEKAADTTVDATVDSLEAASAGPRNNAQLAAITDQLRLDGMGSNAWALAAERTENGRGLLLANPHYPWYGIARFWEKHLTIPGEMDTYGASLIGTPGVSIGFNAHVGWSHTVSDSKRTVLYQLTLNPENPQQYRWQDGWRDLSFRDVSVELLTDSGLTQKPHRFWSSHHGPLIALPGLSQDPYTVFAIRDANEANTQTLAQWLAMGQAQDMDAFIEAHRRYNAMPWVNTIAASADGRAVYLDNSTVAALSDEALLAWQQRIEQVPELKQLYLAKGLVILDGSTPRDDWQETDAPVPFTEPFERRPLIESNGFVFNANDSYWLSDPTAPTEGYSPLYGATGSPRSLRTRMNIGLLSPESAQGYAGADGKFSIAEVQAALFGNDALAPALLLPSLLEACEATPSVSLEGTTVSLQASCEVLADWDQRYDIDSKGAVLFREWLTRYSYEQTYLAGGLFAEPFDPERPADTPAGLADPSGALERLAAAQTLLTDAGIGLDVSLGELQRGHRAGQAIALHGGNRYEGIANLQVTGSHPSPVFTGSEEPIGDSAMLTASGYNINHGSSFIMTLGFDEKGPSGLASLSYSQSGNPASPHFTDQTMLYAQKRWRPIRFHPEDIAAATQSSMTISSPR